MVRHIDSATVISYHHNKFDWCTTSARDLHTRFKLVGRSVYWYNLIAILITHGLTPRTLLYRKNIVKNSRDPTFLFVAILWSALYAWDEALETLYKHIRRLVRAQSAFQPQNSG